MYEKYLNVLELNQVSLLIVTTMYFAVIYRNLLLLSFLFMYNCNDDSSLNINLNVLIYNDCKTNYLTSL